MDFKKHLEKSWRMTIQCIIPLIFMTLVMVTVSILTLGILGPVMMAGYMHSVLLLVREGREPKIQDVFSQMKHFLPLLAFGIAVFIAIAIGWAMMVLPGLLIMIAVIFTCIYMLPLMTDKHLILIEAVKESCSMSLQGDLLDHAIVVILFLGISWVGSFVVVGWLFTQPLATIFILSVYEERMSETPPGDQTLRQKDM